MTDPTDRPEPSGGDLLTAALAVFTVEGMLSMTCSEPAMVRRWCDRIVEMDQWGIFAVLVGTAGKVLVQSRFPDAPAPDEIDTLTVRYIHGPSGRDVPADDAPPLAVAQAELIGAVLAQDGERMYRQIRALWRDRRGIAAQFLFDLVVEIHDDYHRQLRAAARKAN